MSAARIVAVVLIVAGIVGLMYGAFGHTGETHKTKLGSLELSIQEKRTVNVPLWTGVGALLVGGALLLVPHKKSWSLLFLLYFGFLGNLSRGFIR